MQRKQKTNLTSLLVCTCLCVNVVFGLPHKFDCVTAKNSPPILPPSQSEGSPPSLTSQGSFLSVLCRLAMCCSYLFHFIILDLQNVTKAFCTLFVERRCSAEDALLSKCTCGILLGVLKGDTFKVAVLQFILS